MSSREVNTPLVPFLIFPLNQSFLVARSDCTALFGPSIWTKTPTLILPSFYTYLPPSPPSHLTSRTFTIPPPSSHPLYPHFIPSSNSLSSDEVSAHMGMFNARTNDGFYDLGLAVIRGIGQRVEEEGVGSGGTNLNCLGVSEAMEEGLLGDVPGKIDEKSGSIDGGGGGLGKGWREEKEDGKVIWVDE